MPKFGFNDDEQIDQDPVVPLYADNPNGVPGWWDEDEDEDWEVE